MRPVTTEKADTMQNKTAIVLIPVHQRPEVTLFCMNAIDTLCGQAEEYGWDVWPYYVGDEDWARVAVHGQDFGWVQCGNDGIGRKMNKGLFVVSHFAWDWLITLGSDDLMRPQIFASANYMAAEGLKFFGTNDCILYDWRTGEAKRHNSGTQIIGAGRFVHRSLVEQCDYRLWPDEAMSGLDGQSEQRIEHVTGHYIQYMPTAHPFIVDIKSEVNIHSYEDIPGTKMRRERLMKLFPVLESHRHGGLQSL